MKFILWIKFAQFVDLLHILLLKAVLTFYIEEIQLLYMKPIFPLEFSLNSCTTRNSCSCCSTEIRLRSLMIFSVQTDGRSMQFSSIHYLENLEKTQHICPFIYLLVWRSWIKRMEKNGKKYEKPRQFTVMVNELCVSKI